MESLGCDSLKISVIVSVYNIEDYLPQALDSLAAQTYQNMEVIMVDDGSADRSGDICRSYAKQYDYFQTVEKTNGGLSSARNSGLRNSTGEYVLFLDGDDLLHPDFVKSFVDILNNGTDYDCILGRMSYFTDDISKAKPDSFLFHEKICIYETGRQAFTALTSNGRWFMTGIRGLYRRQFLLDDDLWFLEGLKYSEDQEWTVRMLSSAGKTGINSFPGYYYRENRPGSLMNTLSLKKVKDTVGIYSEWYMWCLNRPHDDAFLNAVYLQIGKRYSSLICSSYDKIRKEEKRDFYRFIKKNRYLLKCTDDRRVKFINILSRLLGFRLLLALLKIKK